MPLASNGSETAPVAASRPSGGMNCGGLMGSFIRVVEHQCHKRGPDCDSSK